MNFIQSAFLLFFTHISTFCNPFKNQSIKNDEISKYRKKLILTPRRLLMVDLSISASVSHLQCITDRIVQEKVDFS